MDKAISLKTNQPLAASELSYEESKRLAPICPECKEPVHLRRYPDTGVVAHFAHYSVKKGEAITCSLRVLGYWNEPHKSTGMWATRGQLIEKIQLELVAFFSDQFGSKKNDVNRCIKRLIDEYSDYEWIYADFIDNLAEAGPIYEKVRQITMLDNDAGREVVDHYNIAISSLQSTRLQKAVYGLLWCSLIASSSLSKKYGKEADPDIGIVCNGQGFDYSFDKKKFERIVDGTAGFPTSRNYIYYRCVSIGQVLIIRLLAGWRYPACVRRPFMAFCDRPVLMSSQMNSVIAQGKEVRPPWFQSLEERHRWISEHNG